MCTHGLHHLPACWKGGLEQCCIGMKLSAVSAVVWEMCAEEGKKPYDERAVLRGLVLGSDMRRPLLGIRWMPS